MPLIDEVQGLCERLAPLGWHDLLLLHGLDIQARPLAEELSKVLAVDRSVKGFEDFSLQGTRAIEAGNPARSLLYHALASPNVLQAANGDALTDFATAAELETLLNYVYGVALPSLEALQAQAGANATLGLVVFATEYRPRADTPHHQHADLCFCRTGIARVGTAPALYDPQLRGFTPFVEAQPQAMRVIPARFGVYVAVREKGQTGPGWVEGDDQLDFWRPLHKVFNGTQCIAGFDLQVDLQAFHVNEKLRQFHLRRDQEADWFEPDISQPPFVQTQALAEWADSQLYGPGLCIPVAKPRLVEPAEYQGKPVSFSVPPKANFDYIINKRYQLLDDGSIRDLNNDPDVEAIVEAGNYRALHFIDFTAEGWVKAHCPALNAAIGLNVAAYSILAAPDFYPACGQAQLGEWAQEQGFPEPIWYVTLQALSERRVAGNPDLMGGHFVLEDKSITAVLTAGAPSEQGQTVGDSASAKRQSCLADTAAGTFSPGWEIAGDGQGFVTKYLCAYLLGSPFTEDVRICSAAGGYWPAVTPDSARTFEPYVSKPTIIPLTDAEIGLLEQTPWDGLTGPRLITVDGRQVVECTAYAYSDYTRNALDGQLSLHLTGHTSQAEYQQRILAMQSAYAAVGAGGSRFEQGKWSVLSFTPVDGVDWALPRADLKAWSLLQEQVFFFRIYRYGTISTPADYTKRHIEVLELVELYIGDESLLIKRNDQPWQKTPRG